MGENERGNVIHQLTNGHPSWALAGEHRAAGHLNSSHTAAGEMPEQSFAPRSAHLPDYLRVAQKMLQLAYGDAGGAAALAAVFWGI
jgi:hypothetical protein